ncbi:MAG: hypothetical protein LQ342_006848 [Letrouitia transgressa]|nr:MAG: hypothetical protein LQ342_006848 [Letrouitia transgressa]
MFVPSHLGLPAPILEICHTLHRRGHVIEFATLAERENLVRDYPFVSKVYIVGRAITLAEEEELYTIFSRWNFSTSAGKKDFMKGKKFHDGFWPETYSNLKRVVDQTSPDFIFADYQVEAARDVASEFQTPLATMWPQMPWLMVPQKYIPGEPGMQQKCLTSEHATFFERLYDETYILRSLLPFLDFLCWSRKMRRNAGVRTKPHAKAKKPDYLLFVNSFFGLEIPKDLPPLIQAVGPVLSDTYSPCGTELEAFYSTHTRTVYIAFGTHVILNFPTILALIQGLATAIAATTIDSIIWAIRPMAQKQIPLSSPIGPITSDPLLSNMTWSQLLTNQHPCFYFTSHAPQRAILAHPSTILFLTHAGPSSANEALFAGVPMLTMGIYGDQLPNSMRLREAGVALSLDKHNFTSKEVSVKIGQLVQDQGGHFGRNVLRMKRIANIAARKKDMAADLIEEVLYDHELRFEPASNELEGTKEVFDTGSDTPEHPDVESNSGPKGPRQRRKQLRPMHLQTADVRISWWKRHNVDFWAVGITIMLLGLGIVLIIILAGVGIIG